jgi:hypothetical protein
MPSSRLLVGVALPDTEVTLTVSRFVNVEVSAASGVPVASVRQPCRK